LNFHEMLETIRSFQRLQSLLQAGPVGSDHLRAKIDQGPSVESSNSDHSVEVFPMLAGFQQRFGKRHMDEMIITLAEVEQKWPDIAGRWSKYHEKFEEVLNLYFSVIYGESLFIEGQFLFLMQALEGYHRIQSNFQKAPLRDRLTTVIQSHAAIFSRFLSDPDKFCLQLRTGRDYLTHPGEQRLAGLVKNIDFVVLTSRLSAVLRICFLEDVGIPRSAIDRIAYLRSLRFRSPV
jgi:ApeA N-terminal domain 1